VQPFLQWKSNKYYILRVSVFVAMCNLPAYCDLTKQGVTLCSFYCRNATLWWTRTSLLLLRQPARLDTWP